MMNLPSVRHLRHLTALHDYGHFGRAADACHVTQSTLSASIKELEAVLQVTLVDRSKRRVVLTPVGVETVERARKIVREVEDLVSFTTASRDPLSGTLRLGTIPTIGPFLLPRLLPVCAKPIAALSSIWWRTTDRLLASLHRGELDVVLLALPRECGAVETVVLFEDPFVVGLPHGHPLAKEARHQTSTFIGRGLLLLKEGTACATTRSQRCAVSPSSVLPSSRRPACRPWCRWSTTDLVLRCCRHGGRSRLAGGHELVTRPLVNYELARKISLVGVAVPDGGKNSSCWRKELTQRVKSARGACGNALARRRAGSGALPPS